MKTRKNNMDMFLWVLQLVLAIVFLLHGLLFLTMTPAREEQLQKRRPDAKPLPKLPRWFMLFIGVAEVFGAAGLILPGLSGSMISRTASTTYICQGFSQKHYSSSASFIARSTSQALFRGSTR